MVFCFIIVVLYICMYNFNKKPMTPLEIKIKNRIDDYLEFDTNQLLKYTDYAIIFGGAVRDSIADQPINDVDIMALNHSIEYLILNLERNGYSLSNLTKPNITCLYDLTHIIFEPITYMNKNRKIIQLIRPSIGKILSMKPKVRPTVSVFTNELKFDLVSDECAAKTAYFTLLSNVDISCCGVAFDGFNLYETIPMAVKQCMNKEFDYISSNMMVHHNRVHDRIAKMESRGWSLLHDSGLSDKQVERNNKLKFMMTDHLQLEDLKQGLNYYKHNKLNSDNII